MTAYINLLKSWAKHVLRIDGFPTDKLIQKRGPRPKVMDLYYMCEDCGVMVPLGTDLCCEICGSKSVRPIHRHENPKYDIKALLSIKKAEKEALGAI